jgi:hypothetical protein
MAAAVSAGGRRQGGGGALRNESGLKIYDNMIVHLIQLSNTAKCQFKCFGLFMNVHRIQ